MKSKNIFFIILVLLPVNLGKHFIFKNSYVDGILVDYLVPTVFVQDLLIILMLVLWFFENKALNKLKVFTKKVFTKKKAFLFLIGYVLITSISVFVSKAPLISFLEYLRMFFYFLFSVYVVIEVEFAKEFKSILKFLVIGALVSCVFGFGQFLKQGSLFNNYLVLGEQPFTFSTRNIIKENVLGVSTIPAYGLFRHANIFGGYLSVILILLLGYIKFFDKNIRPVTFFVSAVLVLALLLTLSVSAWLGLLLGLILLMFEKSKNYMPALFVAIFLLGFSVLYVNNLFKNEPPASIHRRQNLMLSSLEMIKKQPFFGVGYKSNTLHIEDYLTKYSQGLRFVQPVHNIFILTFSESGIFAIVFLMSFFVVLFSLAKKTVGADTLPFISLLQVAFMGSFDHYFFTIHQTQLLFWLLTGLAMGVSLKHIDK